MVRAGDWVTMLDQYLVPEPFQTTYRVSVRRSAPDDKSELYPMRLAERLPVIPVTLREGEPDVLIDLQTSIDRVHQNGGYAEETDHSAACDPPLTADEAQWAGELLKAAGRR